MYLGLYIYINDNRERELYSPICSVTSVHRRLVIHKFYSPVAKLEFTKSCTRNFNPFSKLYLWSDICHGLRLCQYWKGSESKQHSWCEHALSVMVAMSATALLNKTWLIYYYHCTALMFKMFEFRALFCPFYLDHLPDICQWLLSLSTFILLISSLWTFLTTSLKFSACLVVFMLTQA